MKTPLRHLLIAAAIAFAPAAYSASVPGLDVIITQNGKAVYRGKTDESGSFSTGALQPGNYNVEFRAPKSLSLRGQQLSISVSPGKGAPMTSKADGKHMQGGVAMTVDVAKVAKVSGKVSAAAGVASSDNAPAPAGYVKVKANVKMINGKRHVWVPAPIGSNMGGKWVEEGSEEARLSTSNRKGEDGEVLTRIQDQAGNIGQP